MMQPDAALALYQHSRRPRWGLAILAWEGRDKRRYQFQDGRLRTFKKGYYHLFDPIDRPLDVATDIADELSSKLEVSRARREAVVDARSKGKRLISLEDQLAAFAHQYPDGFDGETWRDAVRGAEAGRNLKRHRDQAIATAQEHLSAERLDAWLAAGDGPAVLASMAAVVQGTDLERPGVAAAIRALDGAVGLALGQPLRDLLYGEGDYGPRFTTWVSALAGAGLTVAWPVATLLPALVHPGDHVVIKPASFRDQARWMAPGLDMDLVPTASLYARLLSMTFRLRMRLEQAGHEPRDLMDVYQFVWTTLRPSAKAFIKQLREGGASEMGAAAAPDDSDV